MQTKAFPRHRRLPRNRLYPVSLTCFAGAFLLVVIFGREGHLLEPEGRHITAPSVLTSSEPRVATAGTIGNAASAANENPLLVVKLGAAAELGGKAADFPVVKPLGFFGTKHLSADPAFSGGEGAGSGGFLDGVLQHEGSSILTTAVASASSAASAVASSGSPNHKTGLTEKSYPQATAEVGTAAEAKAEVGGLVTKPLGFYFKGGPGQGFMGKHAVAARIKAALIGNHPKNGTRPLGFYFGLEGAGVGPKGSNSIKGVAAGLAKAVAEREGQPPPLLL